MIYRDVIPSYTATSICSAICSCVFTHLVINYSERLNQQAAHIQWNIGSRKKAASVNLCNSDVRFYDAQTMCFIRISFYVPFPTVVLWTHRGSRSITCVLEINSNNIVLFSPLRSFLYWSLMNNCIEQITVILMSLGNSCLLQPSSKVISNECAEDIYLWLVSNVSMWCMFVCLQRTFNLTFDYVKTITPSLCRL